MSDKRFLGNIITSTPTAPAGPFQDGAASGVWSLQEAFTYTKAGLWPIAGNILERALFAGGSGYESLIQSVTISSLGNAASFGNLTTSMRQLSGCASSTRGVFGAGRAGGSVSNVIEYVTIATAGNSLDFGDLTTSRAVGGAASNSTRGLFGGGDTDVANVNTIDYITIASTGNAIDFGDLSLSRSKVAACASTTRAVWGGGVQSAVTCSSAHGGLA
jgi:hypothetical protein